MLFPLARPTGVAPVASAGINAPWPNYLARRASGAVSTRLTPMIVDTSHVPGLFDAERQDPVDLAEAAAMSDTLTNIARIVSETLEPALLPVAEGDDAVLALLRKLGYDLDTAPAAFGDLAQPATSLLGALDDLLGALFSDTGTEDERNQALEAAATSLTFATAELIAGIDEVASSPSAAFPAGIAPDELVRRLLEMLVIDELDRRGGRAAAILR